MKKELNLIICLLLLFQFSWAQTSKIEEVLIIHHSHLDIGFTHLQPISIEIQKDFINVALDMMDNTAHWPEISRPKWTCELTAPVVDWLESAGETDIDRFKKYAKEGRIGISAMEYHTSPMASAESLIRQLIPAHELEKQLGIEIKTVNFHDITGIPWSVTDLFNESGIELLTMAINLHLSGTPRPQPAIYRWESPSGNELLVMNGEHYSMFDMWLNTAKMNLDTMQLGLQKYIENVHSRGYPYDFVYLSATNAPFAYDNAPPNIDLPGLVRQWNDEGRKPRMRFVTPQDLLDRIKEIPREKLPVIKGDWTDFWNFGAASSAKETKINLNTERQLRTIDLLHAFGTSDPRLKQLTETSWSALNLYYEHTWGAWNTLERKNDFVLAQWYMKAHPAYVGKSLAKYVLKSQLHNITGNNVSCWQYDGVVVVNPTGSALSYHLPIKDGWKKQFKHLSTDLLTSEPFEAANLFTRLYGPVDLKPYSWNFIPFDELPMVDTTDLIRVEDELIETPFYRLRFDPVTGKIVSLYDRHKKWEVLDTESQWGFFQFVHEKPDPEVDASRLAFHVRNLDDAQIGITGWKPEWKAVYSGITGKVECEVERSALGATLIIRSGAEGVEELEQRISLRVDHPQIGLTAKFIKNDVLMPESIYFVFPLNIGEGWKSHFDTGSIPVELDLEQLSGTCRDYLTVNSFVAVHKSDRGVVLGCPDAPLVQVGDFHFGRDQREIQRNKNPLLLAWPINNYWETNFRASQPGYIELNYTFHTTGSFDPEKILTQSQQQFYTPLLYPVENCPERKSGQFMNVTGDGVIVTAIKAAENGNGIIIRLLSVNPEQTVCRLTFPGNFIRKAWLCNPFEENMKVSEVKESVVKVELASRQIKTIRVLLDDNGQDLHSGILV